MFTSAATDPGPPFLIASGTLLMLGAPLRCATEETVVLAEDAGMIRRDMAVVVWWFGDGFVGSWDGA